MCVSDTSVYSRLKIKPCITDPDKGVSVSTSVNIRHVVKSISHFRFLFNVYLPITRCLSSTQWPSISSCLHRVDTSRWDLSVVVFADRITLQRAFKTAKMLTSQLNLRASFDTNLCGFTEYQWSWPFRCFTPSSWANGHQQSRWELNYLQQVYHHFLFSPVCTQWCCICHNQGWAEVIRFCANVVKLYPIFINSTL